MMADLPVALNEFDRACNVHLARKETAVEEFVTVLVTQRTHALEVLQRSLLLGKHLQVQRDLCALAWRDLQPSTSNT